jgi:hypothetical protein
MVEGLTSFNAQLKALKEWPRISIDVARQISKISEKRWCVNAHR